MDGINLETLQGLDSVIESLMPPAPHPSHVPQFLVHPVRFTPTGLGGLVGVNREPLGEILGSRLQATVWIKLEAPDDQALNSSVSSVVRSFMAADRKTLLDMGILKVSLTKIADKTVRGAGGNRSVQQELTFEVLYEYLKRPDEPEEIIEEIPLNLHIG